MAKYTLEENSCTLLTYKYIINDILDSSDEVNGYKNVQGRPGGSLKKEIASEIYSYFTTHYFKALDIYHYENSICRDWVTDGKLNIIDVGANIGTVTFAYIDMLRETNVAENIDFNIILIEPDEYRCELLEKAIDKYIELSDLRITYKIINKKYEESIELIKENFEQVNTVILMSNLLNWINLSSEEFQSALKDTINYIEKGCRVINIEATSPTNSQEKIQILYNSLLIDDVNKFCNCKQMPIFDNIEESYFYERSKNKTYKTTKKYYYGLIIKYNVIEENFDYGLIDLAYNKAIYTCRNNSLYDDLEMKYVNSNFKNLRDYIYQLIITGRISDSYNYQYLMKKSRDKTRPLYLDDFINDIITTAIIISEGVIADNRMDDSLSFGNRVDNDRNSPYVFIPYYKQFFEKLREKEKEYLESYKYYYKIDLSKYYNNIDHGKLKNILDNYPELNKNWCISQLKLYINKNFEQYERGKGLPQGPDLSHLLANLYLKEFDDYFSQEFSDVKLIRYVDDMEIIGIEEERCKSVLKNCEDYLRDELKLTINEEKNVNGEIKELLEHDEDSFFNDVSCLTKFILRSIYKLNKINYEKFLSNPKEFLQIYIQCLKKLDIYLPVDWLNIKICSEIEFLNKLNMKFSNMRTLKRWCKSKRIYDVNMKLGKIPESNDPKLINKWYIEFKDNNSEFIETIDSLKKKLSNRLIKILDEVKDDTEKVSENKSIFKFIMNKLSIFKCSELSSRIHEIDEYFPMCNKKSFSAYDECYEYIINKLKEQSIYDYNKYEYAINIWLLGEYKKEEALPILEEIQRESYKYDKSFINTIATEAILKVGKVSDSFKVDLRKQVMESNKYYYIRNALFILNIVDDIDNILEEFDYGKFSCNEERIRIFIDWIKDNKKFNIVESIDRMRQEYKDKYPTYPIDMNYISL